MRVDLIDSWIERQERGRNHFAEIVVVNDSESPNAVVRADLSILIRSPDHPGSAAAAVRIPTQAPTDSDHNLTIPLILEPYAARRGKVCFQAHEEIFTDRVIDSVNLLIEDSRKQVLTVGPVNFRQLG